MRKARRRLNAGSAGRHGARVALQRAFGDVLAERGQIAAALPVHRPGASSSLGQGTTEGGGAAPGPGPGAGAGAAGQWGGEGDGCMTLACAFLARGSSDAVPHSDFIDCVTSAQRALRFPQWNRNACKVGGAWTRFLYSMYAVPFESSLCCAGHRRSASATPLPPGSA
jgi:hypothetical protein